ncbi:MAG TPA: membrane dipeptidase [Mucilaginibacter sp.]|nr:membrane dipeptidase [Mucilaginibacter sp.]
MIKPQSTWSRREFMTAITGTAASVMLSPLTSWAINAIDPRVAAIVAATIGIDTHNHIDVPLVTAEMPGPDIDLYGEMKQSGLSAICMTFALDYQRLTKEGEAWERFQNALTVMDQQLKNNKMKRSLNLADLKSSYKKHQPTVVQSVEGGHFLEGKLDRLSIAYERGLRHLGLLHDSDASVPLGDVYTNQPKFNGLTSFGADVIKECNRLGILVDLAHANIETTAAALKVTQHPVIISHTGLDTQLGNNPDMARMMKPRLISKEQAKLVADAGGVIGVWTHLADSPLEYAQNIRALVDVIGADHVCIGTDTKLTPSYRPGGQGRDQGRPGERTNQAWKDQKTGFYYAVVDAMLNTGFNADEIGKIEGGNFCRVFDSATAGHH